MDGKSERERFEEICQDIWTGMLVLLSYAFFCILALLQPDEMTLKSAGTVQMPFAQVSVNFSEFELFGPLVLALILGYLHFLLGEWHKFETEWRNVASACGDRFFFNLSSKLARGVSLLIFYGSGPILFTWFVYKIRAWPNVLPWEIIPCVTTALLVYLLVRRYPISSRWQQICIYTPFAAAILSIFLSVSCPHVPANF